MATTTVAAAAARQTKETMPPIDQRLQMQEETNTTANRLWRGAASQSIFVYCVFCFRFTVNLFRSYSKSGFGPKV